MEINSKHILNKKIMDSKKIINEVFTRFKPEEVAITWTGGKDSTLGLWLIQQVCEEEGISLPVVFTIDEYDSFDEIETFIKKYV